MARTFFVSFVFRIALAVHAGVAKVDQRFTFGSCQPNIGRLELVLIDRFELVLIGRVRLGLLRPYFDTQSIAFGLLLTLSFSILGASVTLIGKTELPPLGGLETKRTAVPIPVMVGTKAPIATLPQAFTEPCS